MSVQLLQNCNTAEEALEQCGLNWEVHQDGLYVPQCDGFARVPDKYATRRSDTGQVLGLSGRYYKPIQNRESFRFLDSLVDGNDVVYHSGGDFDNGKLVFLQAKIMGDIEPIPGDNIERLILLCTSHDGSSAFRVLFTSNRIVCKNTLMAALAERSGFYGKHTSNVMDRVDEAQEILGMAKSRFGLFEKVMERALDKTMQDWEVEEYLQLVYNFKEDTAYDKQDPRNRSAFESTMEILNHPTNTIGGMQGTAYGAINAVTYYLDHEKPVKTEEGLLDALQAREDKRMQLSWFGGSLDTRRRAYDYLRI